MLLVPSDVSKRATITIIGSSLLSGCLDLQLDFAQIDCGDGTYRIMTKRGVSSSSNTESSDPIIYTDLSEAEQKIVRIAVDEGEYATCESSSKAVESLIDRAYRHLQGREKDTIYLWYQNERYVLRIFAHGKEIP